MSEFEALGRLEQQIPFGNNSKKNKRNDRRAFVVLTLDPRAGSRMAHPATRWATLLKRELQARRKYR